MTNRARIGIIGAGAFTTGRMLPNLVKLPEAEVTAIANRSQHGGWVAEKFGIPRVSTAWREIIESSDVDAVFIGTPPSLHLEVTLAEARTMLGAAPAARARGVRTMLVPPAPWYRGSAFVEHLVKDGFLGQTAAGTEFQHERELRQRADATHPRCSQMAVR